MTDEIVKEETTVTPAELYFKKVEEDLQPKSVIKSIKDISDYKNKLSKSKGEKSISNLNNKHKENLTVISDSYIEDYVDTYGEIREDEKWMFMESSFFLPGEGHMTCLLMTQALPCDDDYSLEPSSEGIRELTTTQAHRAVREFYEEFGASSLYNLAFHSREAFFDKYTLMIPQALLKLKDKPCMLTFKTKLHYNFP